MKEDAAFLLSFNPTALGIMHSAHAVVTFLDFLWSF